MDEDHRADAQADEVSALIRQIRDVEKQLHALTEGETDVIGDPDTGEPIMLQRARPEQGQDSTGLRLILDHLPAFLWTTDADLRLTSLSGTALSATPVDLDEIMGRHLADLEELTHLSGALPAHQRALEGEPARFEVARDGRFYDCSVEPLRNDTGEITGCVGLGIDVTPRVELEQALEASRHTVERRVEERTARLSQAYEELQITEGEIRQQNEELQAAHNQLEAERRLYQELFEFAPDGYIVTDREGIVAEANQAASELLGVRADFLVGKRLSVYVELEDQDAFYSLMSEAKETSHGSRLETILRLHPPGARPFPASVSVTPVQGREDGGGMRWMVRDISETRRLMEENRRHRMLLERLMNVAPVGIALVRGEDHRFEMANPFYHAIPGVKPPVTGRTFSEVFGETPIPHGTDMLDRVYRTAQAVRLTEREGIFVPGEGQSYWNVDLVPLQNLNGTVDGVLILVRDVSQEVRARKDSEGLAADARRHADQLDAVFDAMTDAVVVFDAQGAPLRANRTAAEVYGVDLPGADRETLIERLDLRDPRGRRVPIERLPSSRALRGDQVDKVRYHLVDANGNKLMVVASAAPLGAGGELTGAVVVWHDVTERERLLREVNAQRRRAEELSADLQRERDRLQTIMENTHAHLAYLDANFNFLRVNTAYAEGAGYAKAELIGRNHFDLFPNPENEALFERAKKTGEPVYFQGRPFAHADQPQRAVTYWDWSLVPVKARDGKVEGLVLSLLNVTEREGLMRQLDTEQARLKAIIENSPEAIVVVDERARITLTNPAADEMYARRVPYGEDFATHGDLCICYPDGTAYQPRDLPLTRAALDGERHEDLELALIRPDGEKRELLVSTAPIQNREGDVTGAVGVFRDITERKRIEEAMQQYAERLRLLHELDQAIMVTHSAQGIAEATLKRLRQLLRCRRASVELFDFEGEETRLLAVDVEGETTVQQGQRMPLSWHQSLPHLQKGQVHVVEDLARVPPSPLIDSLKREGIQSFVSIPLRASGKLIGALNVGMDATGEPKPQQMAAITETAQELAIGIHHAWLHRELQKYASELEHRVAVRTAQLEASEARFRAIFEQSALGIALLDLTGHVIISNQALQRMLDQSKKELLGRRLTDFVPPDEDIDADLETYREIRSGSRDHHRLQTRYVTSDDDTRWANMVLSLVRDSQDEPQFVIAMVEDVTERKRAQQALLQSEKLATTGRLAASLAHEINNPLQTVVGCLGLAEESMEAGGDDVEMYVTMAHEELKRAARIVGRLRDLSRPSIPGRGEPTDLNDLIDGVLKVSRKKLKNQGIRVVRELAEDLPRPMLAPDRIKQVFLNLVLNASDAMPEGGELTVSTTYDKDTEEVVISVTDQGAGIPDQVMERLFDPFFSTKDEGTGLGLFVSQNIVQEQGGWIEVKSKVGVGSTFSVVLPISQS